MKTRKITTSAEETKHLAASIMSELHGGEILLFIGQLGLGKTTFIQGALASFGVTTGVTSPTFVLKKSYPLPANPQKIEMVHHLDLYRIPQPDEFLLLDLDACFQPHDLTFIEWGERIAPQLHDRPILRLEFELLPDERRVITIDH